MFYDNSNDFKFIDTVLDSTGKLPRRFILCGDSIQDEGQFIDTKISEIMDIYGNRRLPHIGFMNLFGIDKYESLFIYHFEQPKRSDYRGGLVAADGKRYPITAIPKGSYTLGCVFTQPWANRAGFCSTKTLVQQREDKLGFLDMSNLDTFGDAYKLLPPFDKIPIGKEIFLWAQMYLSVAFDVYHRWLVGIKRKDIEICFPFLRQDIKEVYKLRDIPDGRKRRSALKTIVSRYNRTSADSGVTTEVREHFRNTDSFTMDGETYTVYPSLDDFERIGEVPRT